MYCGHCGGPNPDGATFCGACGKPLPPSSGAGPAARPRAVPDAARSDARDGAAPGPAPAPTSPRAGPTLTPGGFDPPPPRAFGAGAPQPTVAGAPTAPPVPTYMVPAIGITLCCCLPLGIVAIVHASRVSGLERAGDRDAALRASASARRWCFIGLAIGAVAQIAWLVLSSAWLDL